MAAGGEGTQRKHLHLDLKRGKGANSGESSPQKIDEVPVSPEVYNGDILHIRKAPRINQK